MKKLTTLILIELFTITFVGCKSNISHPSKPDIASNEKCEEVYSFPEPIPQIKVTYFFQGTETTFTIGSDIYDPNDFSAVPIAEWFYELNLTACKKPENLIELEYYDFIIGENSEFRYEIQGEQTFIVVNGQWYEVSNPSNPPIK